MILRKVTLSHWRAIEKFELVLEDGLNILQGRNEAGKSSVVEAIDWALYRDISGARIPTAEIRSIVPATDPSARPTVEVDLEFPDCRATLLKILSEDSAKRECRLTLRRNGQADEYFDRTEAQKRFKALLSADGLGEEKGGSASGGLLVAHQGESAEFLSEGTAAIRSTLGVGSDGQLALTIRLEKARAALEIQRRREILQDLETSALEVARAGTDAAKTRDELKEARFQLEHFQEISSNIEALRDRLSGLRQSLGEIVPQHVAAQQLLEELSKHVLLQNEGDKIVLNTQSVEREAKIALDAAQNRSDEIKRLRLMQSDTQRELDGSESAVETARLALQNAQEIYDAANEALEKAANEAESSRHVADAWKYYEAVFLAQSALKEERKSLENLRSLGQILSQAQEYKNAAGKAPTENEIRIWRRAFEDLSKLESEAAEGVQLGVRFDSGATARWNADGKIGLSGALGAGEEKHFAAISEGVLHLDGIGKIQVRTGARGVEELKSEVLAARDSLQEMLSVWNVELTQLPASFETLEIKRTSLDAAEFAWKEAVEDLRREEARVGSLSEAEKRVAEKEAEFLVARERCQEFEGVIELGGKKLREVKDALITAEKEAKEFSTRASRLRNEAAKVAQSLRDAEIEWHRVKARPDALRETLSQRGSELSRLEGGLPNETARTALLAELNQNLARARMAREAATESRRAMGDGISQWKLSESRRNAGELSQQREKLEREQTACERDLFHACGQNADAEIDRLTYRIEELEEIAKRHEARLRGVLLLDAIIQAERARLSRDLAGPLNEKLGPWLSKLRGKETALAFDEAGARISDILTKDGESTISLPFSEHSEGLKEQVAFALRLLLATRVASHLPSKKLPLILDDPFTQSDASRTGGLGDVLQDADKSLQILFVTCHSAPQVGSLKINTILLGDWDDAQSAEARSKRTKKPEKEIVNKIYAKEESLALF